MAKSVALISSLIYLSIMEMHLCSFRSEITKGNRRAATESTTSFAMSFSRPISAVSILQRRTKAKRKQLSNLLKKPEFYFDENLRDIPVDLVETRLYISQLKELLHTQLEPQKRVSTLGEIGVYLRSIGDLEAAEHILKTALREIKQHSLGLETEIQQKIRLAHVLQWKKDFTKSTSIFDEIIRICQSSPEAEPYLDFAWQHAGKNYFDQQLYQEARQAFENALQLRKKRNAPNDQIESSQSALKRTIELIRNK